MELSLAKQELLQVAPVSERGTLKLAPGKRDKSLVAVGDASGTLTVAEVKKGVPTVLFREGGGSDPIHRVELGGPPDKRDRLFLSRGTTVSGVNKKGKEFFAMRTTLTEPIRAMKVGDTMIYAAAETTYTVFDNGSEVGAWISPESIQDVAIDYLTRAEAHDAVLACTDGIVRICPVAEPLLEAPTTAGRLDCIHSYGRARPGTGAEAAAAAAAAASSRSSRRATQSLLYGSSAGIVGELLFDGESLRPGWSLPASAGGAGAVTALTSHDLTADGVNDVIVGRDTGDVQVFSFDTAPGEPSHVFTHHASESIRAIDCGQVSTADHEEIAFLTFSGRVASLTTEALGQRDVDDRYGRSKAAVQKEAQVALLRTEVEKLRAQIVTETSKLRSEADRVGISAAQLGLLDEKEAAARGPASGAREASADLTRRVGPNAVIVPVGSGPMATQLAKPFDVTSSFALDPSTGSHRLTVEIPVPIDAVILESTVDIAPLDTEHHSAIVSVTRALPIGPVASDQPAGIIIVYRCQEPTQRLEVRLRSVEGRAGDIQVTVVARTDPKTAQSSTVQIRPLSLHHRLASAIEARAAATTSWQAWVTAQREARAATVGADGAPIGSGPGFDPSAAAMGNGRRGDQVADDDDDAGDDGNADHKTAVGWAGAAGAAAAAGVSGSGAAIASGDALFMHGAGDPGPAVLSMLTISGALTLVQLHACLVDVVNDVPSRLPPGADRLDLAFRSCVLGTVLIARLQSGEAVFESDSISALAILRERVTRAAANAAVRVTTRFEAAPHALSRHLAFLRAPLERTLGLTRRAELYASVKEVVQGEADLAFLAPDLRDVLERGEEYRREMRSRHRILEMLFGGVVDAFLDWHKFHGRDVSSQVRGLLDLLPDYDHERVERFMAKPV